MNRYRLIDKIKRGISCLILILFTKFTIAQNLAQQDTLIVEYEQYTNIAYGKKPTKYITSAISSVTGEELAKTFTSNFANTLAGRLPGLTVMLNGFEPGNDSPTLYSRGVSTFDASNSPLVLVDGFQAPYEYLNPNEIESVNLLKDASALALYGSRGANGVLLITTKKGQVAPFQANLQVQYGIQSAINIPKYLGSFEYATLFNEALANEGESPLYSDADLELYRNGSNPFFYPDVDWHAVNMQDIAPTSRYTLDFSGGSEKAKYFSLLSYTNTRGLYNNPGDISENIINFNHNLFNFRSNIDVSLTDNFSAIVSVAGGVEDLKSPSSRAFGSLDFNMSTTPPLAFPIFNEDGSYAGDSGYTNPYANLREQGYSETNKRMLTTALTLKQDLSDITEGLSISAAISYNSQLLDVTNKTKSYARYEAFLNSQNEVGYIQYGLDTTLDISDATEDQWRNNTIRGILDYKRIFDRVHDLDFMALVNWEKYTIPGTLPFKHLDFSGRFTYTYNKTYVLEGAISSMGSDNFAEDKRFGLFHATSIGWIVSNEKFMSSMKNVVNFMKLRASYGLTGNDVIGGRRYMFTETYTGANGYNLGQDNGFRFGESEGQAANPNVTWEKDKMFNIGLEAILFNNLSLSFDYFENERTDILVFPSAVLPQFIGAQFPLLNSGMVYNKGFEASLNYSSATSNDFKYNLQTNVWYAKDEVVFDAQPDNPNANLNRIGYPVFQPFLLRSLGFFADQDDIDNSPSQAGFGDIRPGDIKYEDTNGDGIVNDNDAQAIGKSGIPEITANLSLDMEYKRFDLGLFFQGVFGRTVYKSGPYYQAFQNNGKISPAALGRWTPETAQSATYPRLSTSNNRNNFRFSTFWQDSGDFIKLRSLEFGYTLPDNISHNIDLQLVRFFFNGTNLFSIDDIDDTNPESLFGGYPEVSVYSVGLKVQF